MPLLALPNELLLLAASTLPAHDLASLILTSRRLCSLLTPSLTALARQDHRALHHAVHHGYHDVLQRLLCRGVPASIGDNRNITALYEAVRRGDEVAVRLLLDHGAAPGLGATRNNVKPLLKAVAGTSEEIVRMLLEAGADPNKAAYGSITPMRVVYALRSSRRTDAAWEEKVARRGVGWEERVAEMLERYGAPKRTAVDMTGLGGRGCTGRFGVSAGSPKPTAES